MRPNLLEFVTPTLSITPIHFVANKCNLQMHFGSNAMGIVYEVFCHHSLPYSDPLFVELLSYLPTLFILHIYDQNIYEKSDDEVDHSDSFFSALYSVDSTYFSSTIWRRWSCAVSIFHQTATELKQTSTHEAAQLIAHFFLPVLAAEDTAPASVPDQRNTNLEERKRPKNILYPS